MNIEQYFKNLNTPKGPVDVVLDTDAYNEIDDQFAIAYMLRNSDKLRVKGICAAPFLNEKASSVADGMIKSYNEILKILELADCNELKDKVFKGSESYLPNERTAVDSESAEFMANIANDYSPENPLYIVAIGAITNVASAIIKNPKITQNAVVVWLGGNSLQTQKGVAEFNMRQDIAAARVVMGCGVPFVQLPCFGVVDQFTTTGPELKYWLSGKNKLCDYLVENTIAEAESYAAGKPWSRVIWDVTAIAWLLNDNGDFMKERLIPSPIPEYDKYYAIDPERHFIKHVYSINRDAVFEDLFIKLAK